MASTPSPPTITSLPPELLYEVLSCLIPHLLSPSSSTNYRNLRSSALVCRAWREPSQRAMLDTVILRTQRQVDEWKRSPARNKFSTRQLEIGGSAGRGPTLLDECAGLLSLAAAAGADGGYEWLSRVLTPPLQHVYVLGADDFPTDAAPLPHPLRTLSLLAEDIDPPILQSTLQSSQSTLSHLHLMHNCSEDVVTWLATYFSSHPFPNLHKLTLENWDVRLRTTQTLLSSLPTLTALEIRMFDTNDITAVGSWAGPGLESLSFTEDGEMFEEGVVELLKVMRLDKFEGLRRINVPTVPRDVFQGKAGIALLEECERRKIALKCRYGYLKADNLLSDF